MVKMQNGGITIEVYESDVPFYKACGYSVATDKPAPVVVTPVETDEPKPAAKKKTSKDE